MSLTVQEKHSLLELARTTIAMVLQGHSPEDLPVDEDRLTPDLVREQGVFVTLRKHGELRGCIGYILPMLPLYQAVMENARNAAFRDPRFAPFMPEELDDVQIEISVLTPPHPVVDVREFRIGVDGIILRKGMHQAVFLPQVASEQGWDVTTTLEYLSQKAGLAPDGWKESSFETFQAEVFSEDDV